MKKDQKFKIHSILRRNSELWQKTHHYKKRQNGEIKRSKRKKIQNLKKKVRIAKNKQFSEKLQELKLTIARNKVTMALFYWETSFPTVLLRQCQCSRVDNISEFLEGFKPVQRVFGMFSPPSGVSKRCVALTGPSPRPLKAVTCRM